MNRLPIPPERIGETIAAEPAERHYLVDVLRLGDGDAIQVFDGLGGRFPAKIRLDASGQVLLELGGRLPDEDSGASISIAPALIKNDRLDWAVEKATELGVTRISPWSGANGVVRLDEERGRRRQERWQKIAASAARQCGRAFIPQVEEPSDLRRVLESAAQLGELAVVLYERELSERFSHVVRRAPAQRPVLIVTGPEGGFREEEIALARALGAVTASIGTRILRAETAPLAAVAAFRALRDEY